MLQGPIFLPKCKVTGTSGVPYFVECGIRNVYILVIILLETQQQATFYIDGRQY